MITVLHYSFGLHGLVMTYTYKNKKTTLAFDPNATCQLFEELGIIEGFDIDRNGEPVILWKDRMYGRPVIEWCLWCDFATSFDFIERHAEIIAERRENQKRSRKDKAILSELLRPLQATA